MGIKENRERVTGNEQYYTNDEVVAVCVELCRPYLKKEHIIIEPAAGDGAFLDGFKDARFPNNTLAYDIDSERVEVLKQDFLTTNLSPFNGMLFAITNPPFGRANSLNVKFFNHLAPHSEYIGFLVPISWRKWSIQNRLNSSFHLVSDTDMPLHCFHTPEGVSLDKGILKTVFQVWEKRPVAREKIKIENRGYFIKTSPENADVAFTAFGYKVGRVETDFERVSNTCKLFLKVKNPQITEALKKIDVKRFTQNSAYTEVISMEEIRSLLNEHFDKK